MKTSNTKLNKNSILNIKHFNGEETIIRNEANDLIVTTQSFIK